MTTQPSLLPNNTSKRLVLWALAVAAIQMIPFLGRFPWTLNDYVFASVVLFSAAMIFELTIKQVKNNTYRIALGFGILGGVLMIWAWAVA